MATVNIDCNGATIEKIYGGWLMYGDNFLNHPKLELGDVVVFTNYSIEPGWTAGDAPLDIEYTCSDDNYIVSINTADYPAGISGMDDMVASGTISLEVTALSEGDMEWETTVILSSPAPDPGNKALGGNAIPFLKQKIEAAGGLTTLSYGNSTWQDFINAYNTGKIVYCRASSSANPATGSQTRMAFMAYVSNPSTPTSVEFQYVRSVNNKSASAQVDQVFVYKLTNANGGTWTVETRDMASTVVAGTNMTSSYSNGVLTLNATGGGGGGSTILYYNNANVKFYEDAQFTTAMSIADVVAAMYSGSVTIVFPDDGGYSQMMTVGGAWGPTTVTAQNANDWHASAIDYNGDYQPITIQSFADNTIQIGT